MAILNCLNHPNLRWRCKDIAISDGRYNGARNIFFFGVECEGPLRYSEIGVTECSCPSSDLRVLFMDAEQ